MKLEEIKSPVSALSGVGPSTSKAFSKLNIFTVGDLLSFYPRDYEDRRKRISISQFELGKVHTVAEICGQEWFGYGKMKTLKLIINDGTASASLICFNRSFLQHSLNVGTIIAVTGDFVVKYGQIQSTAFDITKLADSGSLSDFENAPLPDSGIILHPQNAVSRRHTHRFSIVDHGLINPSTAAATQASAVGGCSSSRHPATRAYA